MKVFISDIKNYNLPIPEAIDQSLHIITEDEEGNLEESYIYVKRTKLRRGSKNMKSELEERSKTLRDNLNYKEVTDYKVVLNFLKTFLKEII